MYGHSNAQVDIMLCLTGVRQSLATQAKHGRRIHFFCTFPLDGINYYLSLSLYSKRKSLMTTYEGDNAAIHRTGWFTE